MLFRLDLSEDGGFLLCKFHKPDDLNDRFEGKWKDLATGKHYRYVSGIKGKPMVRLGGIVTQVNEDKKYILFK